MWAPGERVSVWAKAKVTAKVKVMVKGTVRREYMTGGPSGPKGRSDALWAYGQKRQCGGAGIRWAHLYQPSTNSTAAARRSSTKMTLPARQDLQCITKAGGGLHGGACAEGR